MHLTISPVSSRAACVCALLLLAGCGGGSTKTSPSGSPGTSPTSAQVSGSSPLSATCGNTVPSGTSETFTVGSGIQPQIAVIPGGAVVGVWEQDRWLGLGARAIVAAHSTDSGATWSTPIVLPFSACGGGSGAGASYDRASDPWVSFAGSGLVVASALAFSANGFTAGGFSSTGGPSAVLVSRSTDGGSTWSTPVAVRTDANSGTGPFFFNDRDSVTADPSSANVYVVWDQLNSNATGGPAYLALSKDGGVSWTSGILYDPGAGNQTLNNVVAVLPSGAVLDFFTLLLAATSTSSLQVVKLTVTGTSWTVSSPVTIAPMNSVGTPNPTPSATAAIRDGSLLAQIAVDPASGAMAAVWQQSSSSSCTINGVAVACDGVALSVSKDGGATWSAMPKQVNGVKTVAAFSPTVRYLPGSVLAITYYDLRDYVAGSSVLNTSAWLSESSDGGTTWHELRLQSPFDLNKAPLTDNPKGGVPTALFLGDNQGLALVGGNALPFYAATNSAGAHVYATQSPSPLTSSSSHVYSAAALRPLSAAAMAASRANAERMRLRGVPLGQRQ